MGRSKKTCEKDSAKRLKKGEPRTSGKEVKKEKSKPDVREKVKKERKASSSQRLRNRALVLRLQVPRRTPGSRSKRNSSWRVWLLLSA